jgi:hypothetical protein
MAAAVGWDFASVLIVLQESRRARGALWYG